MDHGNVVSGALQTHANLKDAAGVSGCDHLRPRIDDVAHLPAKRLFGNLGVGEVVDTGRTATPVGLLHLDQLDAGNHAEHLSRLLVHPLTMHQVAGILVGNLEADGARRWPEPEADEELGGSLYCPGETGGGLASTRII